MDALAPDVYAVLVADWHRKQQECPKCGRPREQCSDPQTDWYPQRTVCFAEMVTARFNQQYEDQHKAMPFHDGTFTTWWSTRTPFAPYRYNEGVSIWASPVDLNPDDDFLNNGEAVADDGGTP